MTVEEVGDGDGDGREDGADAEDAGKEDPEFVVVFVAEVDGADGTSESLVGDRRERGEGIFDEHGADEEHDDADDEGDDGYEGGRDTH